MATMTSMVRAAVRRLSRNALRSRGFASDAAPPQPPKTATTAVPNAGTIARKKKQSKDSRFVTVGLPLLLFVAGGYIALTQVCITCCIHPCNHAQATHAYVLSLSVRLCAVCRRQV